MSGHSLTFIEPLRSSHTLYKSEKTSISYFFSFLDRTLKHLGQNAVKLPLIRSVQVARVSYKNIYSFGPVHIDERFTIFFG